MINEKQKKILSKKDTKGLEASYIKASIENDVELVEYILFSKELKTNPTVNCRNYQAIRDCANQGSMDVIQFLLTDKRINKTQELVEARKQVLIRNACHSGNLNLVKYLLETPGIKEHIKISINKYKPFEEAIYSFNKDLVFYLFDKYKDEMKDKFKYLTVFFQKIYKQGFLDYSKKLVENKEIEKYFVLSDKYSAITEFINQNNREGLEYIFNYPDSLVQKQALKSLEYGSVIVAMSKANVDILNFLIVEKNIELNNVLKQFFENKTYNTENIQKLFQNRELYKKLDSNLSELPKSKKNKI